MQCLQQMVGLSFKVNKHLGSNPDKAAFYLAAQMVQMGQVPDGPAIPRLKELGYRIRAKWDESGKVVEAHVIKPSGSYYVGTDALAEWDKLFGGRREVADEFPAGFFPAVK